MFQTPIATMPNRRGFPCAPPIHRHNSCLLESRERVSADRVRQVMVYKAHASRRWPKMHCVRIPAAPLVPHTQEGANGVQHVQISEWPAPQRIAFEIVAKELPRRWPSKTHFTHLLRLAL